MRLLKLRGAKQQRRAQPQLGLTGKQIALQRKAAPQQHQSQRVPQASKRTLWMQQQRPRPVCGVLCRCLALCRGRCRCRHLYFPLRSCGRQQQLCLCLASGRSCRQ